MESMRAFRLFRKLNTCSDVSGAGNNERSENGSITIFLSCILLPLIIAEMTIINLCALTAAKQIVNDAGKMSSNAALTDYNKTLHDMYGLIVFDGDGSEAISRAESTFKENICTGASTGYKEVEAGKNRDFGMSLRHVLKSNMALTFGFAMCISTIFLRISIESTARKTYPLSC